MARGDLVDRYLCLSVDVQGYGANNDVRQGEIQDELVNLLESAGARAGLVRALWIRQPKGDEELSLVPASEPQQRVVGDFCLELDALLHRRNFDREQATRLRLRLALDDGPVQLAPNGFAGRAVVGVSRLVNSGPVKQGLALAEDANLAVIVSHGVYRDWVCSGRSSVRPEWFRRVPVAEKEFVEDAWLWVPGADVHRLALTPVVSPPPPELSVIPPRPAAAKPVRRDATEPVPGLTIGESAIILRSLEILCRGDGARSEWEKLITSLVKVDHPLARNPEAINGDQGIDVVLGQVSGGDIVIWQAKYFTRIDDSQRGRIRESFQTALDKAKERGNRLTRWVLCVPINFDVKTLDWWERWCAKQRDTGVEFELWDESAVVRQLIRPESADVRRYYFGAPSTPVEPPVTLSVEPLVPAPSAPETPWRGGDERWFGGHAYLLHDHPQERPSVDRSLVWREAVADRIDAPARAYLRQVWALRPGTPRLAPARAALREQARLLDLLDGRAGLPRLLDRAEDDLGTTVVSATPDGPTWQEAYRPGVVVLDRIRAAAALGAVLSLCQALTELHRAGASHRALHPDGVVLLDRARRAVPRDIGLAGLPPVAGEGPAVYRAPEQASLPGLAGTPGPRTDVYQVAALTYHTLTSHPPGTGPLVPVRASCPNVPESLDDLLRRCLSRDPRRRPGDLVPLLRALGEARRSLSRGDRE